MGWGGHGLQRDSCYISSSFVLTQHTMGISTDNKLGIFFFFFVIFLCKQYLTFHKTICIKCQILFSEKKLRKIFKKCLQIFLSAIFALNCTPPDLLRSLKHTLNTVELWTVISQQQLLSITATSVQWPHQYNTDKHGYQQNMFSYYENLLCILIRSA